MECGLSLGSNLGDRLAYLQRARDALTVQPNGRLLAQSAVYETQAVDSPPGCEHLLYLNAVIVVDTPLALPDLMDWVRAIEDGIGRRRTCVRNEPRVIDVDVVYAGDALTRAPGRGIPHPRWHTRRFVAQPLCDVRPDLILPGRNRPVKDVLAALPDIPAVTLFAREW